MRSAYYSPDVGGRAFLEMGRYEDPHWTVEDNVPYVQRSAQDLDHRNREEET